MATKKIFLSFTGTLREMAAGRVTEEDLKNGFFLFGCVRQHAIAPGASGEADERKWFKDVANAHPKLVQALLNAEAENRAGWIRPEPMVRLNDWDVLNQLLTKNNMAALQHKEGLPGFTYPGLAESIALSGNPLEAVY